MHQPKSYKLDEGTILIFVSGKNWPVLFAKGYSLLIDTFILRGTTKHEILEEYHRMMSSNGNLFRATGPLWEEPTGHRILLTTARESKLWCFL